MPINAKTKDRIGIALIVFGYLFSFWLFWEDTWGAGLRSMARQELEIHRDATTYCGENLDQCPQCKETCDEGPQPRRELCYAICGRPVQPYKLEVLSIEPAPTPAPSSSGMMPGTDLEAVNPPASSPLAPKRN